MKGSIIFSDFFHMPQREEELFKQLLKEKDKEKKENLISQIHSIRGIYTNEEGLLSVNELKFVSYLLETFSLISINGNVAFYNYSKHKYEYINEQEYLSFFKSILDEVDCRLWSLKLEGRYKSRFRRELNPRLREWSIPENWIVFDNGCFNTAEGVFYHGDYPGIYNFNNTGYSYDENAKAPAFVRFIDDVMGDDKDLIAVVQEVLGYTLCYGTNPMQIIGVFSGGGRNGKGILSNIIMKVHGEENCSATSVSQLSSQFGVAQMFDKVVNISNENNENLVTDTSILKTVSGNDLVMVEKKHKDAIPVHIYTKLFISTNSIMFRDSSKGFQERLVPIPFNYTYTYSPKGPKEKLRDNSLEEKLSKELPGIFNWMYDGLVRLRNNGYRLTKSEAVEKERERIVSSSNPVKLFVKECITFDKDGKERKPDVYRKFREWIGENGVNSGIYQSAHSFYNKFNSILEENSISSETKKIRGYDYYAGISFN